MKSVKIITNTDRKTITVEGNMTPKQILEAEDINYSSAQTMMDGAPLSATEMNTPLDSLMGASNECIIAVIVKLTNA